MSFKRLPASPEGAFELSFDGQAIAARPGDSVAAALLASGRVVFRTTPVSGAPRGPYCMMGSCFDCLVEIDGRPDQQACLTPAKPGMVVKPNDPDREFTP